MMVSERDEFKSYLQWFINTVNRAPKNGVISFANSIMRKHLKTQNKEYNDDVDGLDGLVKEGFNRLKGPTALRFLFDNWVSGLKDEIDGFIQTGNRFNVASYLLIIIDTITDDTRSIIIESFGECDYTIWDVEHLYELLLTYYPEFREISNSDDFANALIRAGVNAVIESSQMFESADAEWMVNIQARMNQIVPKYRSEGLVLFLGAGISIDAGLPSWNRLLTDLRFDMIEQRLLEYNIRVTAEEKQSMSETIARLQGSDPLLNALYTKIGLDEVFEESMSKALYKGVRDEKPLLESIAEFCRPLANGIGVRAIVTYNFDDLLEKELEKLNIKYQSIHSPQAKRQPNTIPIYHVHGFIPSDVKRKSREIDTELVFSEEGYHSLYKDPYHWANITQLNFLIENNCLMIGLSMTDPNLRRLLRIASERSVSPKHYVCLRRGTTSQFPEGKNIPKREVIDAFLNAHYSIQELTMRELGLTILWFTKYEGIAEILHEIQTDQS